MEIVVTLGWVSKLATGSGDIPENESVCGPSQFFSCEKLLEVSSWIRECMDFFFYVNRKKDVVLHSGQKVMKCNEKARVVLESEESAQKFWFIVHCVSWNQVLRPLISQWT